MAETVTASAGTEDEKYIVDYVIQCRKQAMDAAKERRQVWNELWDCYQNKQDNSMKMDWQAKVFAPKVWMKVEKAAAEVKRAFLNISKLFKLSIDDRVIFDPQMKDMLLKIMPMVEARFKRELEESNLTNVYSEMAKAGFLLGIGLPKALWDYDKNSLSYENAEALNTHISPDFKPFQEDRPKYLIEDHEMDFATFRLMAERTNKASGQDLYDMDKIKTMEGEDFRSTDKDYENRKRKGIGQYTEVNKQIYLNYFWGDVIDKDGLNKKENMFYVVANKMYLLRQQENPFLHGNIPHVITFPIVFPHRGISGCSLVEPTAKLLLVYNNLLNMYVDNMNFTINRMYEYESTKMLNPKSIMTLMPGKKFEVKSQGPVIRPVEVIPVSGEAVRGLDTFNREMQEGSGVTEFIEGMPSRKPKTLGEVEIKTAESRGMFDTIARDLEQNSIKPLLEKSYSLLVQFKGFPDIKGKYVIKVGGLSLMLMQKDMVEKIDMVLERAAKSPILASMTNIDDLWKKFLGVLNLQDAYREPEERQQMMAPGAEGGGGDLEAKAADDARNVVARMNPQQILKLTG